MHNAYSYVAFPVPTLVKFSMKSMPTIWHGVLSFGKPVWNTLMVASTYFLLIPNWEIYHEKTS